MAPGKRNEIDWIFKIKTPAGVIIPNAHAYHRALMRSEAHFSHMVTVNAVGWLLFLISLIANFGGLFAPLYAAIVLVLLWSIIIILLFKAVDIYSYMMEVCQDD